VSASDDFASVLEAGRLAPSTYNSQPWLFVWLRSPDVLRRVGEEPARDEWLLLLEDESRRIPEGDPAAAETLISLGACLTNLVLAGKSAGGSSAVRFVDESHPAVASLRGRGALPGHARPVALVGWSSGQGNGKPPRPPSRQPSLSVFLDGKRLDDSSPSGDGREPATPFETRRSERGAYAPRPLPRALLDASFAVASDLLTSVALPPVAVFATEDPAKIARARRLLSRSIRTALGRTAVAREAAYWFRPSRDDALRRGDGEALDAAGFRGVQLWLARLALHPSLGPVLMRLGGAWHVGRRSALNVPTSPLLLTWASLPGTGSPWESEATRECFLSVGCAVEAVWLGLTAAGAGLQFMTPCVVFPDSRNELAKIMELPHGYVPLSLQRAGYPDSPSREPPIRRPLSEIVRIV
jgi:nitroreductase